MRKSLIWLFILFIIVHQRVSAENAVDLGVQIEDVASVPWSDIAKVSPTWIKVQAFSEDQPGILHYHKLSEVLQFIRTAQNKGYKVLISAEGVRSNPIDHLGIYLAFLSSLTSAGVNGLEIWNEENNPNEFNGTVDQYRQVERASYQAIRKINRKTLVIIGALQPNPSEEAWAKGVITLPGNCIGAHYEDYPFTGIDQRLAQIDAFYRQKTVCFTEVGVLQSEVLNGSLSGDFWWAKETTIQKQASILREIVNRLSGHFVILFNVDFTTSGHDPMQGYSIMQSGQCLFCVLH